MAEERVTEVHEPRDTHTHTTVITDERSGSGATWLIVLLLIVAGAIAIWYFAGMRDSEIASNNAVAEAARDFGAAAGQVGDAAQDAAESTTRQVGDAAPDTAEPATD
jgi:hypothetical protein